MQLYFRNSNITPHLSHNHLINPPTPLAVRITLLATSQPQLTRLSVFVSGQSSFAIGQRLLIEKGSVPSLLTPLALVDLSGLAPCDIVRLLSSPELIARSRPTLVVLVPEHDSLVLRLALAAPFTVAAVAAVTVDKQLLAEALRFMSTPMLQNSSQLWLSGLRQPLPPLFTHGQADLELLRLLLMSEKFAEAANQAGYTRRGVQAQVASLYQRLAIKPLYGRQTTVAIAEYILAQLGRI